MKEEKRFRYWLCKVEGIGDGTTKRLLEAFGSAKEVYGAPDKYLEMLLKPKQLENLKKSRQIWQVEEEYHSLEIRNIQLLLPEEETYPEHLKHIPDPPMTLFCKGKLPEDDVMSVAVIGARECSEYGRYVAQGLGKALGEQGVQVISGMARGVDGISQMAALEGGGASFAVLGCGVDICYPSTNQELYDRLLQEGGVLSPFPPGTKPRPQNFPPRNRIVSGLADIVIVVEARDKSGTLITVDMALEQGREVYVVPGRITDRLSDGCNKLIKQGAGVILSPYDFLEEIVQSGNVIPKKETAVKEQGKLSPEQRQVYETLDFYPRSLDEIMKDLPKDFTAIQVNTILLELCMIQLATQLTPGHFSLKV